MLGSSLASDVNWGEFKGIFLGLGWSETDNPMFSSFAFVWGIRTDLLE